MRNCLNSQAVKASGFGYLRKNAAWPDARLQKRLRKASRSACVGGTTLDASGSARRVMKAWTASL